VFRGPHSLDTGQLGRERLTLASDWDEYQILVLKSSSNSNSSSIFCCTRATARRQKRAQRLAEPKNDHREKPVSARYRRSSRESEASKRNKGPSGSHLSPFAGAEPPIRFPRPLTFDLADPPIRRFADPFLPAADPPIRRLADSFLPLADPPIRRYADPFLPPADPPTRRFADSFHPLADPPLRRPVSPSVRQSLELRHLFT
jgi:hypothetical protein